MIEECEHRTGRRLPEAVRQWYLVDGVVALRDDPQLPQDEQDHLWYDYSNADHPEPLEVVLRQFAGELEEPNRVRVLVENQSVCSWYVELDGSEDPPVIVDESYDYRPEAPEGLEVQEWVKVADHFSGFVFDWIAGFYFRDYTPLCERTYNPSRRTRPPREKPYLDGLWLYASQAETVAPPYLDFLSENFTEDDRKKVADGVTQYQFHNDDGRIRVTTDSYGEEGGVSAWWLHANSEEKLFRLAERVLWCGNLRATLRHWTKAARPVMDRLRADGPRAGA
jgi:hypothetical protein